MDKIFCIMGDTVIYWNSLVYTLAVMTAVCFFLAFYLNKCGNAVAGFAAVPLSIVLSLVLARFVHWYSRTDSYEGFLSAMTDYSSGGYALIGVFAGCALAAALLRLIRFHGSIPGMLDSMCLAGAAGITVGRLASLFNASDRGQILQVLRFLPFAHPVTNAVSGVEEYRLATFMLQSLVALAIFLILGIFYLKNRDSLKDGDVCLLFLLIYGASQVVLDSTRYDSLFFRSNGFVSIVQVFGALGLGLSIALYSRRMVNARGFRFWQIFLWILIAAAVGGAGFMEYYVQRHGDQALFAYSVMTACLSAIIAMTLLIRGIAVSWERKNANSVG